MSNVSDKFEYITGIINRNNVGIDGTIIDRKRMTLEWFKDQVNIGDQLSPVIVDYMLSRESIDSNIRNRGSIAHLIALGSIIGTAKYDAVIWGSGILGAVQLVQIARFRRLIKYDIRAVRGPLTKEYLNVAGYHNDAVLGDPAILMPLIYNPKEEKKYDISVVHHYVADADGKEENVHSISVQTTNWKNFIDEIVSSKKVISSSLHGIILAETYGVPAVFINENVDEQLFKYYDWYFSTGRREVRIAYSLEEAIALPPMELPKLDKMRDNLIRSFPYDLYYKRE